MQKSRAAALKIDSRSLPCYNNSMFFIGVFGIEEDVKELGAIRNIVCPACGRYASARLVLQYTFFHFFFIPLFKWNKIYLIRLDCCRALYACDKDTADEVLRTGTVDFDQCKRQTQEPGGERHCPYCGGRLDGSFVYCPYCGKRL